MTIQNGAFMLFLILLSMYTFSAMRTLFPSPLVGKVYLGVALLGDILLCYIIFNQRWREIMEYNPGIGILLSCLVSLMLAQILWSAVLAVDDLRGLFSLLVKKAHLFIRSLKHDPGLPSKEAVRFSRSLFLQWFGFSIAAFLYGMLGWGIGNRYNYKVRREKLHLNGLSDAWNGLRIVQLSDIHCGSFSNYDAVERGVRMINAMKPDIIVFTGDLVNNRAREVERWKMLFKTLRAPMGIFSVLGNHDYGDYIAWDNPQAKQANLDRLKAIQKEMGWQLLLNENVLLQKEGAADAIALIGVENWSASTRFRCYGDLTKAYKGCAHIPVKVLLSHDPSHWDAEVRNAFPDIGLMLSGHTHGMQFGLETPFFKWSPVQWLYKQWAGMYRKEDQRLYVNRGFGYIGYTGRVGIMPEITVFEVV